MANESSPQKQKQVEKEQAAVGKKCRQDNNQNETKKKIQKARSLYSFSQARCMARSYGFASREEFVEYECAGSYKLPRNPHEVWTSEWTSWDDFLGIPMAFAEGRTVARQLGIQNREEYLSWWTEQQKIIKNNQTGVDKPFLLLAGRLPYRPDLKYKTEWQGWEDWLGLK